MRRLILIPLFALIGCWDFNALNATNFVSSDAGDVDMYHCDTTLNSKAEDCTNGIDDNEDCLVDCADPTCAGNVKCFDPMNKLLGYGSRIATASSCPGTQTTTAIGQNLNLDPNCSTGCACQAGVNQTCSSKVHWFGGATPLTDCQANANELGNATLLTTNAAPLANDCDAITTPMTAYYYKVDAISQSCPLDNTKQGTKVADFLTKSKLCSTAVTPTTCQDLKCMQSAGNCIAYAGNVTTCPTAFPFRELWYQGFTDGRVCTCACGVGAGSCAITATQAQFTDSLTCSAAGNPKTNPVTMTAACVQAGIMANTVAAAALSFGAHAICQASGSAPMDLTAEMAANRVTLNNPITLCCQQ